MRLASPGSLGGTMSGTMPSMPKVRNQIVGAPQMPSMPNPFGGTMGPTGRSMMGPMGMGRRDYRQQMGMGGFGRSMIDKLMAGNYMGGRPNVGANADMGLNARQGQRLANWFERSPFSQPGFQGPFGQPQVMPQQPQPATGGWSGFGPNPNDPASVAWWGRPYEPNDIRYYI